MNIYYKDEIHFKIFNSSVFNEYILLKLFLKIYLLFLNSHIVTSHIKNNVLKTGPVTESEKLSVHGSLVRLVVEVRLNR